MDSTPPNNSPKYFDIGFNMVDPMYQGIYNGKQKHKPDLLNVLKRCHDTHVYKLLTTGSSIKESKENIKIIKSILNTDTIGDKIALYYTIGVHPCCGNELVIPYSNSTIDNPSNDTENDSIDLSNIQVKRFIQSKFIELYNLISEQLINDEKHFKSVGEIGLDYDRFHYCNEDIQKFVFEQQLKITCLLSSGNSPHKDLPLFLHMRNCCDDFVKILNKFINGFVDYSDELDFQQIIYTKDNNCNAIIDQKSGKLYYKFNPAKKLVVHSFTGSATDLKKLFDLNIDNLYIGLNGCSLKNQDILDLLSPADNGNKTQEKNILPLDKILLETDAPWCAIRKTHPSWDLLSPMMNDFPNECYPDLNNWYRSVKPDKPDKLSDEERKTTMTKPRNEPCTMGQVVKVVSEAKKLPFNQVMQRIWQNTCDFYGV
ncbi:related to Deoxyribonuclease Tat-D [Saccharomycodes ludwigii]|uniref:Related to Deoxyribonuclease Tat-D n=1 Tax=Saccharomycodes ludwigii TaxID=36035 RepID=A0A376BAI3_9ASCO|nr:related to Deoxyribonuclease Tat-D [Saccharomycodes ludwigii]